MPLALTGWEIGLALTAAVFIVFALIVSMVIPRTRPDFPSRYLGWFVAACLVFFVGQMTAVLLLAEVGEEHEAAAETETGGEETSEEPTTTTTTSPTETTPTETDPAETQPETEPETTTGETETAPPAGGEGDPAAGREVFLGAANCGACHTLADAGTSGAIGPNLDESQPSFELALDRVTNGQGAMPAFSDTLSEGEIRDVAAYVSTAARG
jgi:mono/diheme cytochrome c family protein